MNKIRDIRDIAVTIAAVLLIISMVHWEEGLYFGLPISNDNAKWRNFDVSVNAKVKHKNSCVDGHDFMN